MAIILDEEDLKFLKEAGLRFFNNEEKYRNAPIRRERGDFEECWVYTDSNYVVFSGTAKARHRSLITPERSIQRNLSEVNKNEYYS